MTTIDISRLTPQERLDLIGELCDSLDDMDVPISDAWKAELDRRLATADADLAESRSWETIRSEITARHR